jgi:hypothetical protein
MNAADIELAVAHHYGWRANIIVPNVSWGWHLRYEADLVILRPSGWASEIEIKVSASDIRADLSKHHQHDSTRFRDLWLAVPVELASNPDIPAEAGILAVGPDGVRVVRCAKLKPGRRKVTDKEKLRLLELAHMRVWGLKAHLQRQREGRRMR